MNSKFTTLALTAILFCCNSLYSAATVWTWEGNFDSDWFLKGNWSTTDGDATVGSTDTVIINNGNAVYPSIGGNVVAGSFIMNGGWFFSNSYDVTVSDNITINSGNFYADASLVTADNIFLMSGGVIVMEGNKFNISDDIVVDGGYLYIRAVNVVIPDDLFLISGTLDLNGQNLTVNNEFTFEGGVLINAGSTLNIDNMIIDYSGSVTLNYSINILSSLQFIDGIIKTSTTNIVVFDHDASAIGASAASHISGPVRRLVGASGNTDFEFPTGNDVVFAPISISDFAQVRSQDFFTAQYFEGSAPFNHASKDGSINHISDAEYWILDRAATAGTPDTDVKVRLSFNETNRSGIVDVASELVVAKWDGATWKDLGFSSATGNNTSGSFKTTSVVTDFSPFTIGSSTGGNPLPVSLLNFHALPLEKEVKVIWSTSSEINNDFFTVQKSTDGKSWSAIGIVDGIENSTQLNNYSFIDHKPVHGAQYYRLIQTDLNGASTVSDIVKVNFTLTTAVVLFPNPAVSSVNVSLSEAASDATIQVFNSMGMKVLELNNQSGSMFAIDMSELERGIYTIEVRHENGVSVSRVLKN